MAKFDPYHRWLGIPSHEQPPTLYRLLGLSDFESDREVITEAAYRQIGHVKQYASGPNRDAANEILNELSKAQVILSNPRKKTQYDISIQEVTEEEREAASEIANSNTIPDFQSQETAAPIDRSQPTLGKLGLLAVLALVSISLVSLCFWWLRDSDVPQSEIAAANPDATATTNLNEPKAEQAELRETDEALVEPPQLKEAIKTKLVDTNLTEAKPVEVKSTDVKPSGKSEPDALIRKQPVPQGHSKRVTTVAFSPDGKQIVSCGDDDTIKLWDSSTGSELRTFVGHSSNVMDIAFSPDGKKIVSAGWSGTLTIWDAINGRKLRTFEGPACPYSVAYSSNGQLIAIGGRDGIELRDPTSGVRTLAFNSNVTYSVASSPNGQQLASGGVGRTVQLWGSVSGRLLRTFELHSRVHCVAFSPNGQQVICGCGDGRIILWDVNSGRKLQRFAGHSRVRSLGFSPDGKRLVSLFVSGVLKIWDVDTAKELLTSTEVSASSKRAMSVTFYPDAQRVIFGKSDGSMGILDVSTGGIEEFATRNRVRRTKKK